MTPLIAKLLHGLCMVAWWVIRRPFERKTKRNVITHDAMDRREKLLLAVSLVAGLNYLASQPAFFLRRDLTASASRSLSPLCGGESEIEGLGERKPPKLQISQVRGSLLLPHGQRMLSGDCR